MLSLLPQYPSARSAKNRKCPTAHALIVEHIRGGKLSLLKRYPDSRERYESWVNESYLRKAVELSQLTRLYNQQKAVKR